jgi:hypothetical protein
MAALRGGGGAGLPGQRLAVLFPGVVVLVVRVMVVARAREVKNECLLVLLR